MIWAYLVGRVLVAPAKLYLQASGEIADVHEAVQPSCLAKRKLAGNLRNQLVLHLVLPLELAQALGYLQFYSCS